jgi:AcrR family transcriptional regulator
MFAEKGFRATTVREIAEAAGILSGSLYHHFDSKESIGDEILSRFLGDVLTDYRMAVAESKNPRTVLERIMRSTVETLTRHRAAVMMLHNDWNYFSTHDRFGYLRAALREIEQIWVSQLNQGRQAGIFRADLDPKLTYRLLRNILWIPVRWHRPGGSWTTTQVADGFIHLVFDGIAVPAKSIHKHG